MQTNINLKANIVNVILARICVHIKPVWITQYNGTTLTIKSKQEHRHWMGCSKIDI